MGRASPAVAAFNAGEWAPQTEGRTDVEKYANACHVSQNFISLKQGPAMFRPGFAYVQPTRASSTRGWLRSFEFSQTQAFIIEFGSQYLRFYTNHGPLLTTGNPTWNSGTAYVVGSQVTYAGITYYCILAHTNHEPDVSPLYWYAMQPYNGSATTAIYEIPSPWIAGDLTDANGQFALQFVQSGDVLYIAGGAAFATTATGYPPYTLTRYANNPPNWQLARYAPTDGPFSPGLPVMPNGNIALTCSAVQGTAVTVTAFGGTPFAATDVGRLLRIAQQNFNVPGWNTNIAITAGQYVSNGGNNYLALNSGTTGSTPPVHTAGSAPDGPLSTNIIWLYTDSTYGVGQITSVTSSSQVVVNVLRRFPAGVVGSQATITNITQANPCVITCANTALAGQPLFVTGVVGMTQLNNNAYTNQTTSAANVTLVGVDSTSFTAYTSGGTVISNASYEWQLGAWSNTTEWPRSCAFFKDRLFWAGKLYVWGSVPGQYTSHAPDQFGQVVTSSATNNLVSGSDASGINWLSPAIILLIGTQGGEYGLDAAAYSTAPLGPANIAILQQSKWRSRAIQPVLAGTSVLYWQRAGRKLQAMDYNFYLNRYDSTDQSKYAYHITLGGVIAMAYQQEPFSLVWAVRNDGTLLSYTFNREDNVTAWNRHNLGGNGAVESIAVVPSPDGLRDELWCIVRRTLNGVTTRTVEYMAKHYEGPQAGYGGDLQSSAWYLDCAAQSVATPAAGATTTTITGLSYLAGYTVGILADGGVQPQQVVPASGIITLTGAFTTVTVGLPYQGNLVPMRLEGGADVGTAMGKRKQGSVVTVRLVDSSSGQIGQLSSGLVNLGGYYNELGQLTLAPTYMDYIRYNDTATALGGPPPIMSGDFPVDFAHAPVTDQDATDFYILIQQNDPLPMTVVGLYPNYEVEEPR